MTWCYMRVSDMEIFSWLWSSKLAVGDSIDTYQHLSSTIGMTSGTGGKIQ